MEITNIAAVWRLKKNSGAENGGNKFMEENRNTTAEADRQIETPRDVGKDNGGESGIGAGKKTGLYGCAFLILGIVIVSIVMFFTGIFNPFVGTEGVGP